MAGIIIFLICSLVFSVCLAQNTDQTSVDVAGSYSLPPSFGPIFYLNSSFPLIWYNNDSNGRALISEDGSTTVRAIISRKESVKFVCGFYCIGSCTYYLFSVAIVGGGNHSVVWSANIGHPVKEGATLQLTLDGELVLRNSDGDHVWSTNTFGKSVVGMNMTEWGNLVLFNNAGSIVWQSYDYPTDTLFVGQRLCEGQKLISSSPNFWARGLYIATLKLAIGFAAYIGGKGQPQMYYQLVPNQTSITSRGPNYAELQQGGFLVNFGTSQSMFKIDPFNFSSTVCIAYIKLGSDGHLKIFHHSNANGSSEIVDMVTHDLGECQHPRHCGEYCLCRRGQCSCPIGIDRVRYFKQTQSQNGEQYQQQTQLQIPHMGCSRISSLSCPSPFDQKHHLVEVENVTYFILIDSDAAFPNINDIERCKEICLLNCSCGAVFFRYNNNASDGYCYIPSTVLTIRGEPIPNHSFTSATYVKVQIPYKVSNRQMEGNVPNTSPPPSPSRNRKNLMAIIAGSCAGSLLIFVVIIVACLVMLRPSCSKDRENFMKQVPGSLVRYSYEQLCVATEDFKERLGGGGFGTVFKGMLGDGTQIAAKRLDKLGQGMKEFFAEVETLGNIHHFNLLRLIGFCAEKSCRLLVYEYMTNGSLDNWIFCNNQRPCLNWQVRKKIILDIAKGLAYLHEECRQRIIHLDIKPQNILLDEDFNAKISDFGLSKLINRDQSHILTTMRGTPGYIAPEWRQPRVTIKADIYSFGIVLLEIVSGRKNFDNTRSESSKYLLKVLQEKAENQLLNMVENLDGVKQYHAKEVVRMIRVGAWCLQNDQSRRPAMSTVVKVLEGLMEVDTNGIFFYSQQPCFDGTTSFSSF